MTQTDGPQKTQTESRRAFARRSDWVRLQTLVFLRWIAISGQIAALIVAKEAFNLRLETGLIWAAIGAAIITNLMATLVYPHAKRLSETELAGTLIFDMVQLSTLLALTGGLHNPFALLVLAQVAIAALALSARPTLIVCGVAVLLTTVLLFVHLPLVTMEGEILRQPPVFVAGFWVAIVIGIAFQASYAHRVASELMTMGEALAATQMALSREQKLTDLGGVVAAAAHELGSPLATIALVAGELVDEASDDDLRADAQLIRDQAERCRIILREMGRAGKDDEHIRIAPLVTVIEEAAEPHSARGIQVDIDARHVDGGSTRQPSVERRPEVIHGMRNLVQNAVDFARTRVLIELRWSEDRVSIRISDDGPGFRADTLPYLGEPFLRHRTSNDDISNRKSYEGMGLGLFIAKTLLERSHAEIVFANGPARDGQDPGAVVQLTWKREDIAVSADRPALPKNMPFS
ncbi:sensor histidine kinase RegB [Palleronia abyssalis]|uniref:histidine kinase n=1 Tax=Palleronia abyssalis TaxID=1501240 RepID=A0A2R8BST7_9RHOB|nr:ActS/PrrB/RegB family redox-sensitive histidine kinase [Palleronia abyssalis]SPJ23198.1 Sensor histidine kinase RegB [Palleronia abyssalis]